MDGNTSLEKALRPTKCQVKKKHVEQIVSTLKKKTMTVDYFWYDAFERIEYDEIRTWKFCYILHYVLFHVFENFCSFLTLTRKKELQKLKNTYGTLVQHYVDYVIMKIEFHQKYGQIPGNWDMELEELDKYIRENKTYQEVFSSLLNLLEKSLDLQLKVVEFLGHKKQLNSMSEEGQFYMTPLPLCLEEMVRIRDFCHHIMCESKFEPELKEDKEQIERVNKKIPRCCRIKYNFVLMSLPSSLRQRLTEKEHKVFVLILCITTKQDMDKLVLNTKKTETGQDVTTAIKVDEDEETMTIPKKTLQNMEVTVVDLEEALKNLNLAIFS